jgi:hypothetical protein
MDFKSWLNLTEIDQTMPDEFAPPDAKGIAYLGCVLHRFNQVYLMEDLIQKLLLGSKGSGIPQGWVKRGHHMTVKFGPRSEDLKAYQNYFGKQFSLKLTNFAYDDHGIAVTVKAPSEFKINGIPHITIAHSRDVGAKYSNTLLGTSANLKPILGDVTLISYFLAAMHDQNKTWPNIGSIPLAAPVMV